MILPKVSSGGDASPVSAESPFDLTDDRLRLEAVLNSQVEVSVPLDAELDRVVRVWGGERLPFSSEIK